MFSDKLAIANFIFAVLLFLFPHKVFLVLLFMGVALGFIYSVWQLCKRVLETIKGNVSE